MSAFGGKADIAPTPVCEAAHARKRYAVVDLITSLAQSCMKAGYVDKESGEGWALMRITAGDVWIAVGALTGLTLTIAIASAAKPCLTQAEAQKRWPKAHLFWHTANHCWDNLPLNAVRASDYDKPNLQSTPAAPAQMIDSMQDWSEMPPVAAKREIFFPTVKHNDTEFFGLAPVPPLNWPVTWFTPAPISGWPQLLDIDRAPFINWERRIGR